MQYLGKAEGDNPPPLPAGHSSLDTVEDTVGLLGCKCTLLSHVKHVYIHPRLLRYIEIGMYMHRDGKHLATLLYIFKFTETDEARAVDDYES